MQRETALKYQAGCRIRMSETIDLCVICIEVRFQTVCTNQLKQICRV